jgi:hypothetical protein
LSDYLSGRQNVLTNDESEKIDLNSYLETVAQEFGIDWLQRSDGNPVQELWGLSGLVHSEPLWCFGRLRPRIFAER